MLKTNRSSMKFTHGVFPLILILCIGALTLHLNGNSLLAEEPVPKLKLTLPVPTAQQQQAENNDAVVVARLSPAGRYLALGMHSGSLVVFDLHQGRLIFARKTHAKPLKLLDFAQDDRYLLTGADDLEVHCWDVPAGRMRVKFQGAPLRMLYDISLAPDSHYAAARGFDGFGVLWDLRNNKKVTDLFSYMFAFDPNNRFLVTAPRRRPGAELLQFARISKPIVVLQDQSINGLAVAPNGGTIALAIATWDEPGEVVLMDTGSGRELRRLTLPVDSEKKNIAVTALCFSPDNTQLLIGRGNGDIRCLSVVSGQATNRYRFLGSVTVGHVEFVGPDGQYIVASGWSNGPGMETEMETRCWKHGGAEPIWVKPNAVSFGPDGRLVARVTSSGDLELMRGSNGHRLMKLRGYEQGTRWLEIDD